MRRLLLVLFLFVLVVPMGAQEYRLKAPAGSAVDPGILFPGEAVGLYSPGPGYIGVSSQGTAYGLMVSTLVNNNPGGAAAIWGTSNRLAFEGTTENEFETEIAVTDPTADRLITLPNTTGTVVLQNDFNYNIPDNGNGGTAATYTLEPAGYRIATLSCADANGCTVTMGETGVVSGASIVVFQIAAGTGNITLVDDDGTTAELDGDTNVTLNALDSVTLHYAGTIGSWIQTAYIDIS